MPGFIYNEIGKHYSIHRRADPRLAEEIFSLLRLRKGGCIAEVGAGTGNYAVVLAKKGYRVVAIEPADVMLQQRNKHPNVFWSKGYAEKIPLADNSVDSAIAILAIHHFRHIRMAFAEMARVVGSGPLLLFTFDPRLIEPPWFAEYFPFLWDETFKYFPPIEEVAHELQLATQENTSIHLFPLPHDLQDNFAAAGWRRPELYLDPVVRACMSGFAIADQSVVNQGVGALMSDLNNGAWDRKHGWLKRFDHYDVGYRFIVSRRN